MLKIDFSYSGGVLASPGWLTFYKQAEEFLSLVKHWEIKLSANDNNYTLAAA